MKKKNKFMWFCIAILVLFLCSCEEKIEYTKGLKFEEEHNGYMVSAGDAENEEHIIIPRMYKNKPVREIASYGFYECTNLKTLEIPDTMEEIGEHAFGYCKNYKEVILPDSIKKIEDNAFEQCGQFDSIVLPKSIEYFCAGVFYGSSVEQLVIQDASTLTYIGGYAFNSIDSVLVLENSFADYKFDNSWDELFASNKMAKIYYNVESYDNYTKDDTFRYFVTGDHNDNIWGAGVIVNQLYVNEKNKGCITLPVNIDGKDVKYFNINLDKYADSIKALKIPNDLKHYNGLSFDMLDSILFEEEPRDLYAINSEIGFCADFGYDEENKIVWATITGDEDNIKIIKSYNLEEENLEIPEKINGKNVVEICDSAYVKHSFNNVILPKYIKRIGESSFSNCKNLVNITFNENLEIIDDCAFYACEKIKELNFPSTLRKIEASSFFGCIALESIKLNQGLELIGSEAFFKNSNVTEIFIPKTVKSIGANAFTKNRNQNNTGSFYTPSGLKELTLKCEASEVQPGWEKNWNVKYYQYHGVTWEFYYDYCAVIWNAEE